MKRILLIIVFSLMSVTSNAKPTDLCVSISKMAEVIMWARQEGYSSAEMIALTERLEGRNADLFSKLMEGMVINAFGIQRHFSDEYKEQEIEGFKSQYYIKCYQSASKHYP